MFRLLFIFQAAYHGHYSFRSGKGSWFIQSLCHVLQESGPEDDLLKVLTKVKRLVSLSKISNVPSQPDLDRKVQIPLVQDTLIREVYLKRDLGHVTPVTSDQPVNGHASDQLTAKDMPPTPVKKKQNGSASTKVSGEKCLCM